MGKTLPCQLLKFYKQVRSEAKEIRDNWLPVSRKLLLQLCAAADLYLQGYNQALAKSLFICTWAFAMRISEYSQTRSKSTRRMGSHNIRSNSIRTSSIGVSIVFHSDKTATFAQAVKHCTVKWECLPDIARAAIEEYISLRPQGAGTFFCNYEGSELRRHDVLNLLHMCLLGSDWRHLNITPHSFRQGYALEALLVGESISEIRNQARWTESSKAFEAYARSNLISLDPVEILQIDDKYRKSWTTERIKHLMQYIVEAPREAKSHPFMIMLGKEFSNGHKILRDYTPGVFPHQLNVQKRRSAEEAREKQVFTKGPTAKAVMQAIKKRKRVLLSAALHQQTLAFHYKAGDFKSKVSHADKFNVFRQTHSTVVQAVPKMKEKAIQTAPVIILDEKVNIHQGDAGTKVVHPEALHLIPELGILVNRVVIPQVSAKPRVEKPVKYTSMEYNFRKSLKSKILRRISPRWRLICRKRSWAAPVPLQ